MPEHATRASLVGPPSLASSSSYLNRSRPASWRWSALPILPVAKLTSSRQPSGVCGGQSSSRSGCPVEHLAGGESIVCGEVQYGTHSYAEILTIRPGGALNRVLVIPPLHALRI